MVHSYPEAGRRHISSALSASPSFLFTVVLRNRHATRCHAYQQSSAQGETGRADIREATPGAARDQATIPASNHLEAQCPRSLASVAPPGSLPIAPWGTCTLGFHRRAYRLSEALERITIVLGGSAGSRLAEQLGILASGLSRFREFGQRDEWKDCSSASH